MTFLRGSLPALVTPLTPTGAVHEDDLATLVARAAADGASGVLVAGSTGEGALLEADQRVQVTRRARTVIDAGPGSTTLVAGATGPTVTALQADVARLAAAGADLVLVLAPSTYPLHVDELVDLHVTVADAAEVPTLLYHLPQYTGSSLTPDALRELATHPRIVGLKDSSPDAERRASFIEAVGGTDGFAVLTGHAPTLRAALEAGADGSITAIANVRQRQIASLHEAVATGDGAGAAHEQAALTRTTEALAAVGSSPPAVLKAALQLDGTIAERWCRRPLRSVPAGRLDHVRTAMMR
ncbi:dihydrodipicolinate synthase family protein [Nitriliruptor alkaliphilus]|uniref:dihydrodipicolinate synthase family protein n=1 Tax=Nitriliruptor alkaliphilus TaxID=427918 RepID=UPI00069604BF|nr:dihydrodipicolinate synthase family protein [Nitriliruptor alkaliphilus]